MEETNLDRAKKQLLPFAQMDDYDQRDIKRLKDAFGQYDSILNEHLTRLNLIELSDRLAWIPFELFQDVKQLAKGGFGTVYTAKLDYSLVYVGEDKTVALKVLDQSLLQEVIIWYYFYHALKRFYTIQCLYLLLIYFKRKLYRRSYSALNCLISSIQFRLPRLSLAFLKKI